MDYKEKYEMALETVQEILDSGEDSIKMSRLKLMLQSVFHELKESEDERIRKGIMLLVKDWWDRVDNNELPPKDKMLAWLERQGEHESSASTLTQEEVQKLHDHLEMHKQLPKSEAQTVTFIDSGSVRIIEKLDEIIGKLGDLYYVSSNESYSWNRCMV